MNRRGLIRQQDVDALVDDDNEQVAADSVESDTDLDSLSAALTAAFDDSTETEAVDEAALAGALDEVHGKDRKLGQRGSCSLVVSADGLRATLRGPLPAGTSQRDVLDWLTEVGITNGVIPGRIFEALPRRRRRETRRARPEEEISTVVVAEGAAPEAPPPPQTLYKVDLPAATDFQHLQKVMQGKDLAEVRRLQLSAELVEAGQVLARVQQAPGKAGCDVFGTSLPAPAAVALPLQAGDGAVVCGNEIQADLSGYVGLLDERLCVIEPVWVSADLLSAYWVALPLAQDKPAPSADKVRAALAGCGIIHGLHDAAIDTVAQQWARGKLDTCTPIARGTEAVRGVMGTWRFGVDPGETRYAREFERILWKAPRPEYIRDYARGLSAWVVNVGQTLARKLPPTEGQMGMDVFGEEYMPDEPREERIEAGDHTFLTGNDTCVAEVYGIVAVEDGRVRIIPPLWLDPSRCTAYLISLPPLGVPCIPSEDELARLLELFGVNYGVDQTTLGVVCEKLRQGIAVDLLECIARGDPPRPGADGAFELAIEQAASTAAFLADGSVDFRAVGQVELVDEGCLLGARTPATPGQPGKDLFRQPIDAPDGIDMQVGLGKGVDEVVGEEGVTFYRAAATGQITFVDHRQRRHPSVYLAVDKVLTIDGDVDFHTGNVQFEGTVQVKGSVRSGFHVEAGGNITIGETVENGAVLDAGGNVLVRLGIVGADTVVTAAGSVICKFVQGAQVRAGDSVTVCEYLLEAKTRADEEIHAVGRAANRKSGAIVGGQAMAGCRVRACRLGAEAGAPTQVIAGARPSDVRRLAELNLSVTRSEALRAKVLQAFGAQAAGTQKLRAMLLAMLTRAKGPKREVVARSIKGFMKLQARLDEAVREREALQAAMRTGCDDARIEVHGPVAPNVTVRIGDQSLRAKDTIAGVTDVTFALGRIKGGDIRLRILPNT